MNDDVSLELRHFDVGETMVRPPLSPIHGGLGSGGNWDPWDSKNQLFLRSLTEQPLFS